MSDDFYYVFLDQILFTSNPVHECLIGRIVNCRQGSEKWSFREKNRVKLKPSLRKRCSIWLEFVPHLIFHLIKTRTRGLILQWKLATFKLFYRTTFVFLLQQTSKKVSLIALVEGRFVVKSAHSDYTDEFTVLLPECEIWKGFYSSYLVEKIVSFVNPYQFSLFSNYCFLDAQFIALEKCVFCAFILQA